jgi:hypothetical protein
MNKKNPIPKIAYVCRALLAGEVLTIMDGFKRWQISNLPRELSRQIEARFDIIISRDKVEFTTEMGLPGWFYRYRINSNDLNKEGIEQISEYISQYFPVTQPSSTINQTALF